MVVHRFQRDTTPCVVALDNSVGGVKVSIVAFQAIDPGSIPGWRIILGSNKLLFDNQPSQKVQLKRATCMISHNVLLPPVARDGIFIQGTGSENLAGFIFDSMLRGLELILLRS